MIGTGITIIVILLSPALSRAIIDRVAASVRLAGYFVGPADIVAGNLFRQISFP